MVENTSYMFVTGPNVVKTVTQETVTAEELGGASTHSTKSGVTHFACANELEAIRHIKRLLSYIPQNCEDQAPVYPYELKKDESRKVLDSLIPENPNQPYDMRDVVRGIVDEESFFWKFMKTMQTTSWLVLQELQEEVSALWAISLSLWLEFWTIMLRSKQPGLCVSAIVSMSRCWFW